MKKSTAPPLERLGWYAVEKIDDGAFWAAWWTTEPASNPWRSPDATGTAKDRKSSAGITDNLGDASVNFAAADAEMAIKAGLGRVTVIRQIDVSFARAARREAEGRPARHRSAKPKPDPAVARQARSYWEQHDWHVGHGFSPLSWEKYNFDRQPPRPKDVPEPPGVAAEIAAGYPTLRAREYWHAVTSFYHYDLRFGRLPPRPKDFGFDREPKPVSESDERTARVYTRAKRREMDEAHAKSRAAEDRRWAEEGRRRREEANRSWEDFWNAWSGQRPASSPRSDETEEAFRALGLDRSAHPAEIKKAFRRIVHERHPDVGGHGGDMAALVRAKETALAYVQCRSANVG